MASTPVNESLVEQDVQEQRVEFLVVSLFMSVLFVSQLLLFVSRTLRMSLLPEAGLLLLLGLLIGWIINLSDRATSLPLDKLTEFDDNLFFVGLLPPIIFESGYTIRRRLFFGNFGVISALAVVSTFANTIMTAFLLYWLSPVLNVYSPSKMECFVLGAILSATDPVTVIAVFNQLGIKPFLHIVVFGESVLNDAVALVLYRTMAEFLDEDKGVEGKSALSASLEFIKISLGSVGVGILIGVLSAGLFKVFDFRAPNMRHMECSLALVTPYISYSVAAAWDLSGIVSILFTGIAMASYTRLNLSDAAEGLLHESFGIIAHLAETFIFIYLGMAVFTGDGDWSGESVGFGFLVYVVISITRPFAVLPVLWTANCTRSNAEKISPREQFVICWSGLRGGMAFALSAASVGELPNKQTGRVFESATTICVFLTVFIQGGTIECICRSLHLRINDMGAGEMKSPLPQPFEDEMTKGEWDDFGAKPVRHSLDDLTMNTGQVSEVELSQLQMNNHNGTLRSGAVVQPMGAAVNTHEIDAEHQMCHDQDVIQGEPLGTWGRFDRKYLIPLLVRDREPQQRIVRQDSSHASSTGSAGTDNDFDASELDRI